MNFKRLKQIPKARLAKKILGFDEVYTICIREADSGTVFDGNDAAFTPIAYSDEFWYADPLPFEYDGCSFLFAEEFDRKIGRGHIAVAEITENPRDMHFQPIIKEDYHMSFPMVFEWNGKVYMIPETSENHSINIYECNLFPHNWNLVSEIKTESMLVDTVVMSKTDQEIQLLTSELNPQNPFQAKFQKLSIRYYDLNRACPDIYFNEGQNYNLFDRNAGTVLETDAGILLPTQISTDCDYGVGISFRNADSLEPLPSNRIDKGKIHVSGISNSRIIGTHTFSRIETKEIIDIRYLKYSPISQYRKLFTS